MHLRGLQVRCRATIQSWRLELSSFRVRARLSVQRLGGDTDLASLRGDRFSLRPDLDFSLELVRADQLSKFL